MDGTQTVAAQAERDAARVEQKPKIDRSARDWYKDAVIYQLHIKAFFDSNSDGIGDFGGLMQRLDYVESLGVNTIWILPFYPSPLRDDGYDIADYRSINTSYGDMRDFRRFVAEAHRRGIRVVTELVINHTSDQHPWFQRARRAKPGSAARDYYVWSDTDQLYQGTRIIFIDTEKSNWTWDPVAGAFFWHRFYSHQPDLNFDSPRVLEEVMKLLHYWLDMGVDGLRLDAIPYLIERDGTNNENLPETHDVLKKIRAEMETHYPDRMLLAEANQWPEDTRPYFGEGDECHMGFHFPLMPRMYMALAQEDRHPITDIIRQTPDIPENCQWAIFLRNHDELTLEMVTAEERDYLWRTYAKDTRARINLGIRRRLAPLMENDRRKIELMNALLLSMPGTPVLYYGDELGMGDNYFLGDRDGVRTPMQWSADRNGGFSRANPQALYLPPVMDPVYGFQAVNVEAQQNEAASLLNWTRRMIAVRQQHKAFGRGALTLFYPRNRKVLAYIRRHGEDRILCVANLSRAAQAVELDLAECRGATPIELTGGTAFPAIGERPYVLTLPAYGFFWFLLAGDAEGKGAVTPPEPLPEFVTLTAPQGRLDRALEGRERQQLERLALPEFLPRQRWFAGKGGELRDVRLNVLGGIAGQASQLALVEAGAGAGRQSYFVPLTALWGEEHLRADAPKLPYTLAKLRHGAVPGALIDATQDARFVHDFAAALAADGDVAVSGGRLRFAPTAAFSGVDLSGDIRPLGGEQSNVSVAIGDTTLVKFYRLLRPGEQPEVEVARFLTERTGFANTPTFYGSVEYVPDECESTTLAAAFALVRNQGDAWSVMLDALDRHLDQMEFTPTGESAPAPSPPDFVYPLDFASTLGRRTAELHLALAADTDDTAFAAEPIGGADLARWSETARAEAGRALDLVSAALPTLPDEARSDGRRLVELREALFQRLAVTAADGDIGLRIRTHGDFHLGQVLVAQDEVIIIDFEGEPQRSLEERREKSSPLRDVAGMLRSFDYLAWSALDRVRARRGQTSPHWRERALLWRDLAIRDFLGAYFPAVEHAGLLPQDAIFRRNLLDLFLLQKAAYELGYEAASRPAWLSIPIRGILDLIAPEQPSHD